MTVKAKLSVTLMADQVEVASSEDADLWQQVLLAITGNKPLSAAQLAPPATSSSSAAVDGQVEQDTNDPLARFAAALAVQIRVLQGACSPTTESPYMNLDAHRYEATRKALPTRGVKAIPNISLAGTLLGLWFYYAGLGNVTQSQAQAILEPLGKRDPNPGRGISNTHWLQMRTGGQFAINPAEISVAIAVARGFCTKDWTAYLNEN